MELDLSPIKKIPIIEVATRLGIQVRGTTAKCFTGHDKATPSLSFSKIRNTWKCFGACGKYGDGVSLVMEKEGIDFNSAVEWFTQNFGVNVSLPYSGKTRSRTSIRKKTSLPPKAADQQEQEFFADPEIYDWFIESCAPISSKQGLDYLDSHAIARETASRFRIRELRDPKCAFRKLLGKWGSARVYRSGMAWGERGQPVALIWSSPAILFPFVEQNSITYIQARMFEGNKKFLNLRGITKPLFNLDRLKDLRAGQLIHLCEGVPDTLALESEGLASIGVLGATSFRVEWVEQFLKLKVVVLGDGDVAGAKFMRDVSTFFEDRGKPVICKSLPVGKDVADVLAQSRRLK